VLATHFDSFLARYEALFQRRYGYLRPVVREVVERYLGWVVVTQYLTQPYRVAIKRYFTYP
jgi:hypothetical protein